MIRIFFVIVLTILFVSASFATPFWGEKTSQPVEIVPVMLNPGQFIWKGDAVPSRPIVVVVSLVEQKVYVYRNGIRIGVSTAN